MCSIPQKSNSKSMNNQYDWTSYLKRTAYLSCLLNVLLPWILINLGHSIYYWNIPIQVKDFDFWCQNSSMCKY